MQVIDCKLGYIRYATINVYQFAFHSQRYTNMFQNTSLLRIGCMDVSFSVHASRGYPRSVAARDSRSPILVHGLNRIRPAFRHRYLNISRVTIGHAMNIYTIAALDSAPEWTLDQIAGLVFASLLVALYFSSKMIDEYVASSQRRELGICEKCGGLNAQSTCEEKECPYNT